VSNGNEHQLMTLMVGVPGAGKTTRALKMVAEGATRISQDELGSKKACVQKVREAMEAGNRIIIDRCNHTVAQRNTWIDLAKRYDYLVDCEYLWVRNTMTPCNRVLDRKDHPTIKESLSDIKKIDIVCKFYDELEVPRMEEGFFAIYMLDNS
jgi:predicted kinase